MPPKKVNFTSIIEKANTIKGSIVEKLDDDDVKEANVLLGQYDDVVDELSAMSTKVRSNNPAKPFIDSQVKDLKKDSQALRERIRHKKMYGDKPEVMGDDEKTRKIVEGAFTVDALNNEDDDKESIWTILQGSGEAVIKFVVAFKNKLAARIRMICDFFSIFQSSDIEKMKGLEDLPEEEQKKGYWQMVKDAAGSLFTYIKSWGPAVFTKVWEWLSSAINSVWEKTKKGSKWVSEKAKEAWNDKVWYRDKVRAFSAWIVENKKSIKLFLVVAKFVKESFCGWLSRRFGKVEFKLSTVASGISDSYGCAYTIAKDLICLNFNDMVRSFAATAFSQLEEYTKATSNPVLSAVLGIATGGGSLLLQGLTSFVSMITKSIGSDLQEVFDMAFQVNEVKDAYAFVYNTFFVDSCITDQTERIDVKNPAKKQEFIERLQSSLDIQFLVVDKEVEYQISRRNSNSIVKFYAGMTRDIPFISDFNLDTKLLEETYTNYLPQLQKVYRNKRERQNDPDYTTKVNAYFELLEERHPKTYQNMLKVHGEERNPVAAVKLSKETVEENTKSFFASIGGLIPGFGTENAPVIQTAVAPQSQELQTDVKTPVIKQEVQ